MSDAALAKRLQTVLERHVARCVRELFAAHGVELGVGPARTEDATRSTYSFAGIIGLVGDLSGTLLVGGDATAVSRSHPLSARRPELSLHDQLDWIGELANQLTGRLKKRLAAHGIAFDFSPPISLTGERLRHIPSKGHTHRASFHAPEVDVGVWVDVTLAEAAAARPEFFDDDSDSESPEGTVTLFDS